MKTNGVIILLLFLISLAVPAISYHQRTVLQLAESLKQQTAENRKIVKSYEIEGAILRHRLQSVSYEQPIDQAVLTSGCGYRMDPMGGGTEGLHKGVDLVGVEGSPIKAALPGTSVRSSMKHRCGAAAPPRAVLLPGRHEDPG
ncbi:MAG: hypothetical protein SVR04_14480, partial [Spirochaetota bacterium]|nr:hypothetical protein [Spirochaetota bacterium]